MHGAKGDARQAAGMGVYALKGKVLEMRLSCSQKKMRRDSHFNPSLSFYILNLCNAPNGLAGGRFYDGLIAHFFFQ